MVIINTSAVNISRRVPFDVEVRGDSFPTGLAGYIMSYTLPPSLNLIGVTFPAIGLTDHTPGRISAVDLQNYAESGALDVLLFTFNLELVQSGATDFILTVSRLDDDSGQPITSRINKRTIQITDPTPSVTHMGYKFSKVDLVQHEIIARFDQGYWDWQPIDSTDLSLGWELQYTRTAIITRPVTQLTDAGFRAVVRGEYWIIGIPMRTTLAELRVAMNRALAVETRRMPVARQV